MHRGPLGSSAHGILQARILEWVAVPSSRGSSQPRDQAWISRTAGDSLPLSHWGRPVTSWLVWKGTLQALRPSLLGSLTSWQGRCPCACDFCTLTFTLGLQGLGRLWAEPRACGAPAPRCGRGKGIFGPQSWATPVKAASCPQPPVGYPQHLLNDWDGCALSWWETFQKGSRQSLRLPEIEIPEASEGRCCTPSLDWVMEAERERLSVAPTASPLQEAPASWCPLTPSASPQ